MYLNDFVEIIYGKLLNEPSISSLGNIKTDATSVNKGDVFVAKDSSNLELAIANGAYAVLSQSYLEMIDDEVAWVFVDSIDDALARFIRYKQLISNIKIFHLNSVVMHIAKSSVHDMRVSFANTLYQCVEALHCEIVFCSFASKVICFDELPFVHYNGFFVKQGDFELKVGGNSVTIPSCFSSDLEFCIGLCETLGVKYSLASYYHSLLPIFINTYGNSVAYGKSMRFVYACDDLELSKRYCEFLSDAKWGRSVLLSNTKIDINIFECWLYEDITSILKLLRNTEYHFFVIYGIKMEKLQKILEVSTPDQTLF